MPEDSQLASGGVDDEIERAVQNVASLDDLEEPQTGGDDT
jgi:hypothetical protein